MADSTTRGKVIEAKRKFRWIDKLMPDGVVARALDLDPNARDAAGPLTLARCLIHHDYPDQSPPRGPLAALDSNLGALWDKIRKPVELRNKLLNPSQFLNTISELALARSLRDSGFDVIIEYEFAEGRDADILASKDGHDYHIDVTNLVSQSMASGMAIGGTVSEVGERDRVVEKLATKFRDKFEGPLERGWSGNAWVALDVAKNDLENVGLVLQQLFRPLEWYQELKAILSRECPTLEGVLVYRSSATDTHVDILGWVKCAV